MPKGAVDLTTFYIWRHIYKSSLSIIEVHKLLPLYLKKKGGSTKHETVDVYLTYHYINLRFTTMWM